MWKRVLQLIRIMIDAAMIAIVVHMMINNEPVEPLILLIWVLNCFLSDIGDLREN